MLSTLFERRDYIDGIDVACYEGPKDYHDISCLKANRDRRRMCLPVDAKGFVVPPSADGNIQTITLNNGDQLKETVSPTDENTVRNIYVHRPAPRACHTSECKDARIAPTCVCNKQYNHPTSELKLSGGATTCPPYADFEDLCQSCKGACLGSGCTASTEPHCAECHEKFLQYRRDERQCFPPETDSTKLSAIISSASFATQSSSNQSVSRIFPPSPKNEEYRCRYLAKVPTVRVRTIRSVANDKGFASQLFVSLLLAAILLGFIVTARDNSAVAYGVAFLDEMVVTEQFGPMHTSPSLVNKTSYLYEKSYGDIFSENGWYDFLELVAFPALGGWGGRTLNSANQNTTALIFGEFVPLTTIELAAIHVKEKDDCGEMPCFPRYSEDWAETTELFHGKFARAPANCENFFYLGHMIWKYGCERYSVEVSHAASSEATSALVDDLRLYRFGSSPSVRLLTLTTFLYHVELETIYSLRTIAEVSDTGGLRTWSKIVPIPMQSVTSLGILCVITTFLYLLMSIYSTIRHCANRHHAHDTIAASILWFIIDIACVGSNVALAIFCLGFLSPATDAMNDKVQRVLLTGDYESFSRNYNDYIDLDTLATYEHALSLIAFVTIVAVFLRLLVFANLVKEIHHVTSSISNAAQSTISLVIIFAIIVAGFGIASTVLWGGVMENFRSMASSMNFLFSMLLGDMEYDQMREFSSPAAFIFILFYLVTALVILLNFIIAILTNSLDETVTQANVSLKWWLWWHLHSKYDSLLDLAYDPQDFINPLNWFRNDCCLGLSQWETNQNRQAQCRNEAEQREANTIEGTVANMVPPTVYSEEQFPISENDKVTFREVTAWARVDQKPTGDIDPSLLSNAALQRAKRQWYYITLKNTAILQQEEEEEKREDVDVHFKKAVKSVVKGNHFDQLVSLIDTMHKEAASSNESSVVVLNENSNAGSPKDTINTDRPHNSLMETMKVAVGSFLNKSQTANEHHESPSAFEGATVVDDDEASKAENAGHEPTGM